MADNKELGIITSGSLVEGLQMRLNSERSIEEVKAGKFVVISGQYHQFFSLITDVSLDSSSPNMLINPPSKDEYLLRQVLAGTNSFKPGWR